MDFRFFVIGGKPLFGEPFKLDSDRNNHNLRGRTSDCIFNARETVLRFSPPTFLRLVTLLCNNVALSRLYKSTVGFFNPNNLLSISGRVSRPLCKVPYPCPRISDQRSQLFLWSNKDLQVVQSRGLPVVPHSVSPNND